MKIRSNAKQILLENYGQTNKEFSFAGWIELEAENDPNFFRWLFDEDLEQDFVCPDKEAFAEFLKSCE